MQTKHYSSVDYLCKRLSLLYAAKQTGNTGMNNNINFILDELLRISVIDSDKKRIQPSALKYF